jgi:hypothetical protein
MKIFKYKIPEFGRNLIEMPEGARIISVANQYEKAVLWAVVDEDRPIIKRAIVAYPTGVDIQAPYMPFLGTILLAEGAFVVHVSDGGEVNS